MSGIDCRKLRVRLYALEFLDAVFQPLVVNEFLCDNLDALGKGVAIRQYLKRCVDVVELGERILGDKVGFAFLACGNVFAYPFLGGFGVVAVFAAILAFLFISDGFLLDAPNFDIHNFKAHIKPQTL